MIKEMASVLKEDGSVCPSRAVYERLRHLKEDVALAYNDYYYH